ncbi:MAG: class I SAM-dependent methyltransferase [Gemmatimonadota bacterium]
MTPGAPDDRPRAWAHALFRRSLIKQAKLREILRLAGATEGKACLDIGGDNGVISLLLRERGGTWTSAEMDGVAVEAIRRLVGERVVLIDGRRTGFEPRSFDLVVIVDFLEHTETDRAFVRDVRRILKPDGRLIVNVPHLRPGSPLPWLRRRLGLTDEAHGHVRPGYDVQGLAAVLGDGFRIEVARTYSRFFSELLDILINAVVASRSGRAGARPGRKGRLVTEADVGRRTPGFRALGIAYPLLWLWTKLDLLCLGTAGHRLIVRAAPREASPPGAGENPVRPDDDRRAEGGGEARGP